ncbi:uncharacterized protein BKA78DRAFT_328762 [Phyllosticta capitalensis]|uniref:uncharacterized protein n=1 Tax=Phyllosticta capitalensis TaxID=121624 RepID=UPI003131A358
MLIMRLMMLLGRLLAASLLVSAAFLSRTASKSRHSCGRLLEPCRSSARLMLISVFLRRRARSADTSTAHHGARIGKFWLIDSCAADESACCSAGKIWELKERS